MGLKSYKITKYKLFLILFSISLSFLMISCNGTKSTIKNTHRINPILAIKDIEEEREITKYINNLSDNGKGFSYHEDGWIYFSRRKHMNYGDTLDIGELYKMKEDGSEIIKLSNDAASNIFVKDGWVYYINDSDFRTFYKIKTDGTDRRQANGEYRMFSYIYIDGWIYFEEYLNKKGQEVDYYGPPGSYPIAAFARMRLDGSDYQRILDLEIGGFSYKPPYLYVKDTSYEFANANGGVIRIHEENLKKDKLNPNEIDYEVVLEHPISGTFFITSDHKVIHALLPAYIDDDKRYIVEESTESSQRKKLKEVDLESFNIKDGWLYGVYSEFDEKNNRFNVEIFRMDKNRKEIIAEFTNDRNTRINIAGDWILYNAYEVKYGLSLDGKEHKKLVEPYKTIGNTEKYEAREKINSIKNILNYLSNEGHYDGEYLNFLTISALENKYEKGSFAVLSEDGIFYKLEKLINMTPEEIVDANIIMAEIDRLKFRFEYLKSIVENKEELITIGDEDIDEAMEILNGIRNFLNSLSQKDYIIVDHLEKRFIDLRNIDEDILFKEIESTSFIPMMNKDMPNQIPMDVIVVMDKKGEFYNVDYLIELPPQEIINLGIQMESLISMKSNFDYIKNVIREHEENN